MQRDRLRDVNQVIILKMFRREISNEGINLIELAEDRVQWINSL